MEYTRKTAKNEFQIYSPFYKNERVDKFVELLNLYYDCIKNAPMEVVKSLLPIDFIGYKGIYLKEWMIEDVKPSKYLPFTLMGRIFDWYGDRTTTDIVTVYANEKDELYRKLLMKYLMYLHSYKAYQKAKDEFEKCTKKLSEYKLSK